MATTNETPLSPRSKKNDEIDNVIIKLIQRNVELGNLDNKEDEQVSRLLNFADDLASYSKVLGEIHNILNAKAHARLLKESDAMFKMFTDTVNAVKTIDARQDNVEASVTAPQGPPPPPPPPPFPTNNAPVNPPAAIQAILNKHKEDADNLCECGEATKVYMEKVCSQCKRKEIRKSRSPLKKRITTANRALEQREKELVIRYKLAKTAREKEAKVKETDALLTQIDAYLATL